jgi:hypothetical protein
MSNKDPNRATRFKEGNKASKGHGHPKGVPNFKTLLKKYLQTQITYRTEDNKDTPFLKQGQQITAKELLAVKWITMATKGNLGALLRIVERLEGFPEEHVNINNKPLQIVYTDEEHIDLENQENFETNIKPKKEDG